MKSHSNRNIKSFLFLLFMSFFLFPASSEALEEVTLHLFYQNGCPHCAAEKEFLKEIENDYTNLTIEMYEVSGNAENANLLTKVKKELGSENPYVPYTVIGKIGMTGFNDNTKRQIIHFIEEYSKTKHQDIVTAIIRGEPILPDEEKKSEVIPPKGEKEPEIAPSQEESYHLPFFGEINPKKISLPLLAIVIGAIDGFNPCAMWVLLFLISMLLGMKDRKRMWILGLTFLFTSGFIYFLFMASWLKLAVSMTSIVWIRNAIAAFALIAGIWNLWSFYKSKDSGCTIIDDKKRKKVFSKIKKFTKEKRLWLALLGTITLAISVNLVELACSAGMPLIFTQILALNNLETGSYFGLIILYIIFFLLDDSIVFIVAMITFEMSGISTKYTKYSHLIGGIILVIIGILLLINPGILMFGL